MKQNVLFSNVKDGEVFEVGGIEFIKFPDQNGQTPAVAKDVLFYSSFGRNNNFAESKILKRLEEKVLPKILEAVGKENLSTFQTDLTTLDGLKNYGTMESKISLPTFDFYRAHPDIFDRHKLSAWWWLATADSSNPRYEPNWAVCVSPRGRIGNIHYNIVNIGVRPFCIFESSIFGSCEE